MTKDKRIGFRDIVQTAYYHEIHQDDHNLSVINNAMQEGEEFSSWEEFLGQSEELIADILDQCLMSLDTSPLAKDDIGYRQGGYPVDIITWHGSDEDSMFLAAKINKD